MLEITFDDAMAEAAAAMRHRRGGIAGKFFADYYAAEANRQLVEHVAKCSVITDEELAQELRKAWHPVTCLNWKDVAPYDQQDWLFVARRAREILAFAQPTAHVFEAGKRYMTEGGTIVTIKRADNPGIFPIIHDRGDGTFHGCTAEGKSCIDEAPMNLIPGAIEDAPAIDWKARAEKAEARLEKVRRWCAGGLSEKGEGAESEAYDDALLDIARAAGFRVIPEVPAQPLRVAACDE